jgi:hypothetical protein
MKGRNPAGALVFLAALLIGPPLALRALQSGLTTASESAPRHYFAFFPAGSTEASLSGYLADSGKRPLIHLPLYERDAMAPMSFVEVEKIQSILLGARRKSGESANREASITLVGQDEPVSAYLREALLVSDAGLITKIPQLTQEGTLTRTD